MKPSEAIAAKLPELRKQLTTLALDVAAKVSGYQFTPEDRAEFEASEDGQKMAQQLEPAVVAGATLAYLDEEAERREAFKREVLERLAKLEKIFAPSPDGKRGPRLGGVILTGYGREACELTRAQVDLAKAAQSYDPLAIAAAYPCSERLPAPEVRVLAFVPSQPKGRRWRVAQWCAPPAQYTDESWRDEESYVGDETIHWKPDQVTHWMPMPGEPEVRDATR